MNDQMGYSAIHIELDFNGNRGLHIGVAHHSITQEFPLMSRSHRQLRYLTQYLDHFSFESRSYIHFNTLIHPIGEYSKIVNNVST